MIGVVFQVLLALVAVLVDELAGLLFPCFLCRLFAGDAGDGREINRGSRVVGGRVCGGGSGGSANHRLRLRGGRLGHWHRASASQWRWQGHAELIFAGHEPDSQANNPVRVDTGSTDVCRGAANAWHRHIKARAPPARDPADTIVDCCGKQKATRGERCTIICLSAASPVSQALHKMWTPNERLTG